MNRGAAGREEFFNGLKACLRGFRREMLENETEKIA